MTSSSDAAGPATTIRAGESDLSFVTVEVIDRKGRLRPDFGERIQFGILGPGEIAAVANADMTGRDGNFLPALPRERSSAPRARPQVPPRPRAGPRPAPAPGADAESSCPLPHAHHDTTTLREWLAATP